LRRPLWGKAVAGTGAVMVAAALALPSAAGASADPAASSQPGSTAVVTPLLQMMVFGDTLGLPLGCSVAASVASNASTSLAPALSETVVTCGTLSSDGYTMLEQGITESSSLTALNTLMNPLLATSASTLQATGTNDAAALGILGPTIASSGGTVAYFEGSS
jgi:hypothetical protein